MQRILSPLTFSNAVAIRSVPGETNRLFILERPGRIAVVPDLTQPTREVWLDLSGRIRLDNFNEMGLLGFTFHPQYATNGRIFVWYTTTTTTAGAVNRRHDRLSEFRVSPGNSNRADVNSERILLQQADDAVNHNGGDLHFGSDGFLYLSIGDGGSGGDPQNHAQRLDSLLGKIVRLDVDRKDGGNPYSVPRDNPFVGTKGARGEIWAYGLRNVWRMSFDPPTGELWAGDVGQNAFEEITLISKGGNHGWKLREGFTAFDKGALAPEMMQPVWDYPRSEGQSVTGGFVYRGKAIPDLVGAYVFGDFASRRVWALRRGQGKPAVREVARAPGPLASFGTDAAGELYACCLDGGIYRLALR